MLTQIHLIVGTNEDKGLPFESIGNACFAVLQVSALSETFE